MPCFDIEVKIRMKIDAPDKDEAERYGEMFVGDALSLLCQDGCNPGEGFAEDTGIAYDGMIPLYRVI